MAVDRSALVEVNVDLDIGESRKRPLYSELDIGTTKRSHQGGVNGSFHFKILVPSVAAGAIIGKGGETIAQLQKDAGARVKMSKANDYYPGTTERVCLITGSAEGIIRIHEFVMEKIKEKPDPNAKIAIDFDHKQPAEREKQVKILVPNSTAGVIIGKGGTYIKQIKEESGAYVQISQKSKDHALVERCITVIGEMENNKIACKMILAKIVEDPQSGSCLNISYSDITGPVANFNPTGSPFANPGSISSTMNNSNASYSSNGSLNSLSPNINNSFNSPSSNMQHPNMMPFSGMGLGGSAAGPVPNAAHMIDSARNSVIESVRNILRRNGYSEPAVSEIVDALNTLADYGMLGPGFSLLSSMINGAPVLGNMAMNIPNSNDGSCSVPTPMGIASQNMFSPSTGLPLGLEAVCSSLSASGPMGAGSRVFASVGVADDIPRMGLRPDFATPTRSNEPFIMQPDAMAYDPFCRSSPTIASPSAAALPVNKNSFGLGTGLNSSPQAMHRSPTPNERQIGDIKKIEVDVG